MIKREAGQVLLKMARGFPVVAVTGPRQSGKTTLVQALFSKKPYLSLEDPDVLDLLSADPRGFLENFPNGAVIDEAQRFPKLFSFLQTVVDRKKNRVFLSLPVPSNSVCSPASASPWPAGRDSSRFFLFPVRTDPGQGENSRLERTAFQGLVSSVV